MKLPQVLFYIFQFFQVQSSIRSRRARAVDSSVVTFHQIDVSKSNDDLKNEGNISDATDTEDPEKNKVFEQDPTTTAATTTATTTTTTTTTAGSEVVIINSLEMDSGTRASPGIEKITGILHRGLASQ